MAKNKTAFPTLSDDLIKELNERWPEKCADIQWDAKMVWYNAGQRSVIRFLNHTFKEQREIQLGK